MGECAPTKPWPPLAACAGFIGVSAALFSLAAGSPSTLLCALLGLAASLLLRRPFRATDRTLVYAFVSAIALAALQSAALGWDDARMGVAAGLLQPRTTAPFLLYLSVASTFFRPSPFMVGGAAASCLAVLAMAGDMSAAAGPRALLSPLGPLPARFGALHAVGSACCLALMVAAFHLPWTLEAEGRGGPGARRAGRARAACLLAALPLGWALLGLYNRFEDTLRPFEMWLMRVGMALPRHGPSVHFGSDVDLGRTLTAEAEENAAAVVLRAVSPRPPGYLRGRAYTRYLDGRWSSPKESQPLRLPSDSSGGLLAFSVFRRPGLPPPSAAHIRVRVVPAARFLSDVLLVPGDAAAVEVVAMRVVQSRHGVLTPEEWEKDGGCVALCPAIGGETAPYPLPRDAAADGSLLDVPEELRAPLDGLLAEAFPDGPPGDDEAAVRGLTCFLSRAFAYSLDAARRGLSGEGDPVARFVVPGARRGHCELFAATAALALRRLGVPTRYCAGFVCRERHPSGLYYVSRVSHGHAWVEAYMRAAGAWAVVEATPSGAWPSPFDAPWSPWERWSDHAAMLLREAMAGARRGQFAEAAAALCAGAWSLLGGAVGAAWGLVAAAALAALWAGARACRRRRAARAAGGALSWAKRRAKARFAAVERAAAGRAGARRLPNETLEMWGARVAAALPSAAVPLRTALALYQEARYRAADPTPAEAQALARAVREAVAALRRAPRQAGRPAPLANFRSTW